PIYGGGDIAAGVPAHAVGHHQQVAARVAGVLVVGPHEADVGPGGIPQGDANRGPRLSSIAVRPIRTWAPGRKGTAPSIRRSDTRVPLVEPDPPPSTRRPAGRRGHAGWRRSRRRAPGCTRVRAR